MMKRDVLLDPPHSLPNPVNISKLPLNQELEFQLNKELSWLGEILDEINQQANGVPGPVAFAQTSIDLKIKLIRRHNHDLQEHLILVGELSIQYFTNCVKTMALMKDQIELNLNSCFISKGFEDSEEYKDQTEIFIDQELRELYFFDKRQIELSEMIREQFYLNKNPYPVRNA